LITSGLFASAIFVGAISLAGVDPESNTDGVNPAAELYDQAEAQRLARVARQLELNDFMAWSVAYGPWSLWGPPVGFPPERQPIGYESKQVGPHKWIYRPLYAEDVPPGAAPNAEPAVAPGAGSGPANDLPAPQGAPDAGQQLPAPRDAAPGDFLPPLDGAPPAAAQQPRARKPVASGPREF
jgi:hypothetical protein